MIYKTYDRGEARVAMQEWLKNYPTLPSLNTDYMKMRKDIERIYESIKSIVPDIKSYEFDVRFGVSLYHYLNKNHPDFNMRLASNDEFWIYLSLRVVPHIVGERWGIDNESHYWSKGVRIWLRSIWWYVYLSWQGNITDTERMLLSECFNTDSILNLSERGGRYGTYINVCRQIMKCYSGIPISKIRKYNEKLEGNLTLFRIVMKLNTVKSLVVEPDLYDGGASGYVKSLFRQANIEV